MCSVSCRQGEIGEWWKSVISPNIYFMVFYFSKTSSLPLSSSYVDAGPTSYKGNQINETFCVYTYIIE